MAEEPKNKTEGGEPKPKKRTNKALEEAKAKAEQLNDTLLRTLAEYDNYRKRTQKEKESMYADGVISAIKAMLPVLDNLERALAASNEESGLGEGVKMIVSQMHEKLGTLGAVQFGEAGEAFDPNRHAAVMHIEDENLPENSVAEVLEKGYIYKDEIVIRHATVKVAN